MIHHEETFQLLAKNHHEMPLPRMMELYHLAEQAIAGTTNERLDPNVTAISIFKDPNGKVSAARAIDAPSGFFVSLNLISENIQMTTGKLWSFEMRDPIRNTHGTKLY